MRFFAVTLIVLLALSIIFPLLYSGVVSDRDEGVFLLIARELKDGSVLYKDYADNKPPGIFFLLIPVVMFAGTDILKIRLAAAFINLLTAIFIFLIGKKVANEKVGAGAAIIYLLLINGFVYIGFILKTETISNLFLCAGVYALLQTEKKDRYYAIVGALIAFAAMIRQVAVYAFLLAAYWIWKAEADKIKKLVLLGAGAALALIPFLLYLLHNGVLMDMIYYTTYGAADVKNMNEIGGLGAGTMIGSIFISGIAVEIILLVLLASYTLKMGAFNERLKLLWLWLLLAALMTPLSSFLSIFFIMMCAVPLSLLASAGGQEGIKEFRELNQGKHKAFSRYVKVCLIAIFFITCIISYPSYVNEHYQRGAIFTNSVTSKDVQYIRGFFEKEGAARPTFFVIMTEPELYYLLNAKSVVRFPFMSTPGFIDGDETVFNEEILTRVRSANVDYVIVNEKREFWEAEPAKKVKESENFRNLMGFVYENYVRKEEQNGIAIYARKTVN